MRTFSLLLAAAFMAASSAVQAQAISTTDAPTSAAKAETTAPIAAGTAAGTLDAAAVPAAPVATTPELSPAAARARASATRRTGGRAVATRPPAHRGFKDGVTVREGQVVATESGRSIYLTDSTTANVRLVTGLEVSATGVVTRPDGTTETLKEGDYISLTGRLTTAQERTAHAQSLKANLKEDRKAAAKRARSPLRQL